MSITTEKTLRQIRHERGITQEGLSGIAKVFQPKISLHETSGLRLTAKEERKIETALGTQINWGD